MKFTREHKYDDEEGVQRHMTSMIDVVFLLLIYFILTASFTMPEEDLASGLQAEAEGPSSAADLLPMIVTVDRRNGRTLYRLGERASEDPDAIVAWLAPLPKEGGVFVRVTDRASVDAAAKALSACKRAGFTKVSYVPAD